MVLIQAVPERRVISNHVQSNFVIMPVSSRNSTVQPEVESYPKIAPLWEVLSNHQPEHVYSTLDKTAKTTGTGSQELKIRDFKRLITKRSHNTNIQPQMHNDQNNNNLLSEVYPTTNSSMTFNWRAFH